MKKKLLLILSGIIILLVLILFLVNKTNEGKIIQTSNGTVLSNKKIGWGIRRNDNHEQPDLGATNKKLIDENDDIAMGNNNEKYVYLTFDEGYELKHGFDIVYYENIVTDNRKDILKILTAIVLKDMYNLDINNETIETLEQKTDEEDEEEGKLLTGEKLQID